jgi:hypothetical protein
MAKRATLVFFVCASLTTLVGCTSNPTYTREETCSQLEASLSDAAVDWPIANQTISDDQADLVASSFDSSGRSASGDLQLVLESWSTGFRQIAPYLLDNDQGGYLREVSAVDQEIFLLANTQLIKLCHWE